MKEKSQIDDMRAAIRGDLDRARARRDGDLRRPSVPETEGALALEPALEPAPEPEVVPEPGDPPVEEPVAVEPQAEEPGAAEEPTPVEPEAAGPVAEHEPAAEPPATAPRQGFLSSLFGRG
jgi:hypothetical protein